MGRQQTCWAEKRFQGQLRGNWRTHTRQESGIGWNPNADTSDGFGSHGRTSTTMRIGSPCPPLCEMDEFYSYFLLTCQTNHNLHTSPVDATAPPAHHEPQRCGGLLLGPLAGPAVLPLRRLLPLRHQLHRAGQRQSCPIPGVCDSPWGTPSTLRLNHFCPLLTFFFAPVLVTFFPSRVSSSCFSATPSKKVKRGAKWAKWGGVARPSGGQKNPKPKAKFAHEEEGAKRSA